MERTRKTTAGFNPKYQKNTPSHVTSKKKKSLSLTPNTSVNSATLSAKDIVHTTAKEKFTSLAQQKHIDNDKFKSIFEQLDGLEKELAKQTITIRHQNLNIEELKAENEHLKTELNSQRLALEGTVLYGNSTNNTSIIEQSWSTVAANKSPKSHTISSMRVATSNRYSAFQSLENPANVCDFVESINLTEEEVTTDSSVKLRPRSNMKTRGSVPA